ncbi:MAG: hypothetical protein OXQ29_21610 [Rhodospirillaceae bacterium]|nr:hypothetical protein [Rhodospirillaceae bacterium]
MKARHRDEIDQFARLVAGDEVAFVSCTWQRLLEAWRHDRREKIRTHAEAVVARYSP